MPLDIEQRVRNELTAEGLHPTRWSNGSRAVYGVHIHPYAKVLVVVSGSITFTLHEAKSERDCPMKAGERLDLPAATPHSARVGSDGVVCLEAHIGAEQE